MKLWFYMVLCFTMFYRFYDVLLRLGSQSSGTQLSVHCGIKAINARPVQRHLNVGRTTGFD